MRDPHRREIKGRVRVIETEIPDGIVPPSTSMDPASRAAVTIPCAHADAVPVESGGETVAALCPTCDRQLPAAWLNCDHAAGAETVEVTALSDPRPQLLCLRCGVDYTEVY